MKRSEIMAGAEYMASSWRDWPRTPGDKVIVMSTRPWVEHQYASGNRPLDSYQFVDLGSFEIPSQFVPASGGNGVLVRIPRRSVRSAPGHFAVIPLSQLRAPYAVGLEQEKAYQEAREAGREAERQQQREHQAKANELRDRVMALTGRTNSISYYGSEIGGLYLKDFEKILGWAEEHIAGC